jgi:ABC-type Fe3+ transport system permease subunit
MLAFIILSIGLGALLYGFMLYYEQFKDDTSIMSAIFQIILLTLIIAGFAALISVAVKL